MENWLPIILVFVGVAVVAILIYIIYRVRNPRPGKGKAHGRNFKREAVVSAARNFARGNKFAIISPAHLKRGDALANLDAIIVGYFGVLGVISLGYGGTIYGKPDEENWVQHAEDGSRHKFPNPINEASACVRVIRDALFSAKLRKIPVEVVYVFSHPKTALAMPRSVQPMRTKDFKKLLKKDKYLDDCGLDMEKVEKALLQSLNDQ